MLILYQIQLIGKIGEWYEKLLICFAWKILSNIPWKHPNFNLDVKWSLTFLFPKFPEYTVPIKRLVTSYVTADVRNKEKHEIRVTTIVGSRDIIVYVIYVSVGSQLKIYNFLNFFPPSRKKINRKKYVSEFVRLKFDQYIIRKNAKYDTNTWKAIVTIALRHALNCSWIKMITMIKNDMHWKFYINKWTHIFHIRVTILICISIVN